MRFQNLKDEYPETPEAIRTMIEHTVKEQLTQTPESSIKHSAARKFSWKKVLAAAVAATLAVGTAAFAGTKLYQWHMEENGEYGRKLQLAPEASPDAEQAPQEIPVLSVTAGYLPKGMELTEDGPDKYVFSGENYQAGISLVFLAMDADLSKENLPVSDTYVTASETLDINGQEAVYLEKQTGSVFDKKLYIAYPEYWQILEIFAGADVTKEEALKIAEGLDVQATEDTQARTSLSSWSGMVTPQAEEGENNIKLAASEEEMKNLHQLGEAFQIFTIAATADGEAVETGDIQGKVTSVQVADNLELLDPAYMQPELSRALDENGQLCMDVLHYIQSGDGTNTLDTELRTEEAAQKLVYVTVEYTNTGTASLKDILYFGSFTGLEAGEKGYTIYDRAAADKDSSTDDVRTDSIGGSGDMDYFDVTGGERKNNYIAALEPGETVTVHLAKIVHEDELDKLYLNLSPEGGACEFSEGALQTGYVDIRQD